MFTRVTTATVAVACSLFLVACGGGGGGGDSGPRYSVQVSPASLQFAAERNGAIPAAQTVSASFRGDGLVVGYAPGVPVPPWLNVATGSSTANPAQIQFAISRTDLQPGTYSTSVRFASGTADGANVVTQDVPVTYVITDPLKVSVTSLAFDASVGSMQPRTVQITGTNIRWNATASEPWLTLSPTSGTGAGGLQINANAASLAAGVHSAELVVTDSNAPITRRVPITFHVSANRWNVSRTGASLVAFSDRGATPAKIIVTNDAHTSDTWTASADVEWLTVTASGGDRGELIIQPKASAAALAADTLHTGVVSVSGSGLTADAVRVGYYRSAAVEPADAHFAVNTGSANPVPGLAIDPIRPYAYLGVSTPDVIRVNLITGAAETLFSTPNAKIGGLVVSGDGSTLFATTVALPGDVVRWNLDASTSLPALPRQTVCCTQQLVWMRQRGVPLLITNKMEVFNSNTGAQSAIVDYPPQSGLDNPLYWYIAGSGDGTSFWNFYQTNASGCSSGRRLRVSTRPSTGDAYLSEFTTAAQTPLLTTGSCATLVRLATDQEGSMWYVLSGTSFYFGAAETPLGPLNPQREFRELAASADGRKVLVYRLFTGAPNDQHLLVLDPTNNVLADIPGMGQAEAISFFAEGRFVVVTGSHQSSGGGLHMFRVP